MTDRESEYATRLPVDYIFLTRCSSNGRNRGSPDHQPVRTIGDFVFTDKRGRAPARAKYFRRAGRAPVIQVSRRNRLPARLSRAMPALPLPALRGERVGVRGVSTSRGVGDCGGAPSSRPPITSGAGSSPPKGGEGARALCTST